MCCDLFFACVNAALGNCSCNLDRWVALDLGYLNQPTQEQDSPVFEGVVGHEELSVYTGKSFELGYLFFSLTKFIR